jgi:hypothetical protein
MATTTPNQTLPNHPDPVGVCTSIGQITYDSNGKPTEVKPPVAPAKAPNSSPAYQMPGSSLNKYVQGVIANTNIEIANADIAHACDVSSNGQYIIFNTSFNLRSLIETDRASSLSIWIGEVSSPIIEAAKQVIDAIKFIANEISKLQKFIQFVTKEIQQLIESIQSLITFIMSLPAQFLQMLANCLAVAESLLVNVVKLQVSAATSNTSTQSTP